MEAIVARGFETAPTVLSLEICRVMCQLATNVRSTRSPQTMDFRYAIRVAVADSDG
jgi:hypothetical protein